MKALVVGGTGFVGMNVVRALVAGGHDVAATRRLHTNTLFARRLGAPLLRAELDDVDALAESMRGRDVVFNCAGHYPRYSLDLEREVAIARARTRNTLEAARRAGVSRYVLTGSVATVGPPRDGRSHSDELDPAEPRSLACVYHAVKHAIEAEVLGAGRAGQDVVVLLPSAIFGELDVKAGTGFLIVAVGNRSLPFFVDGPANVVDADDLARAHILAAERGKSGERYIVGGHDLAVSELLQLFANALDVPLSGRALPAHLAGWLATLGEKRARAANDGRHPPITRELVDVVRYWRFVRNTKADRELGLAAPTPLELTVKKACDWYVRHRYVRLAQGDPHAQRSRDSDSSGHREHNSTHPTGSARPD